MVPIIIAIAVIGVVWWIWALGGNNGKNKKSESVKKSSNINPNRTNQRSTVSNKIQLSDIPIEDNVILYTTYDRKIISTEALRSPEETFGAKVIANTYNNGYGKIVFASKVTQIGARAFMECFYLESVKNPNSVTKIGEYAFYNCKKLKSATIGNSVTSIGNNAFSDCDSLTSITIPDGVTTIEDRAFADCTSLTAFYGKYASADNRCLIANGVLYSFAPAGLTEYTIPNSVTSIGSSAFYKCTSLIGITIPNSATSIGEYAFCDCTSLASVTIPNSVTSIGSSAFSSCKSLTSITIPNSVTSIGWGAFEECTSLTSVTIPDSVTEIRALVFSRCTSLTNIIVSSENTIYDSRNNCNAIIKTATNTLIVGCQTTTIPNSVTSIGNSAFDRCTSLTSIAIPDSVTQISKAAFHECSSLRTITIPNSVIQIAKAAFAGCTSLTNIIVSSENTIYDSRNNCNAIIETATNALIVGCKTTIIPSSVTKIGATAFSLCASLERITIPNSVTSIEEFAFWNCSSLKEVYCKPTVPPTGVSNMFNNNASGRKIYVPRNSVNAYKSAKYWSVYASYIEGYDF